MRLVALLLTSALLISAPGGANQTATSTDPTVQSAIRRIDTATDPAAVVDAYSAGVAIDPNNIELLDAYVQKMIHLELPNQAAGAAEKLLTLQPNNASARVVVADAEARRGQMIEAMSELAIVGPKLSDDKFAVQTAARLFAWYDNDEHKPAIPKSIQPALDQIRHDWQDLLAYRLAYNEAADAYKRDSASTQSSSENNIPPPVTYDTQDYSSASPGPEVYQPGNVYAPDYYTPTYYTPSYYTPEYYTPEYYEPTYYYPYPTYYGSSFILVNNHDNHHRHHGGGHHDGGNHGGGRHDGDHLNNGGPYKVGDPRFMGPVHPEDRGRSDGRRQAAPTARPQARPAAIPAGKPAAKPAAQPARPAPSARPAPAPAKPAPAAAKSGSSNSGGKAGGGSGGKPGGGSGGGGRGHR